MCRVRSDITGRHAQVVFPLRRIIAIKSDWEQRVDTRHSDSSGFRDHIAECGIWPVTIGCS